MSLGGLDGARHGSGGLGLGGLSWVGLGWVRLGGVLNVLLDLNLNDQLQNWNKDNRRVLCTLWKCSGI